MPRKILVFGITGELGSRFARLALLDDHTVYGVSRGKNIRPGADIAGAEIFTGDKLDRDFLADLATKINPDVILDTIPSVAMLAPQFVPEPFYVSFIAFKISKPKPVNVSSRAPMIKTRSPN